MALPSSGALSLLMIQGEFGGTNPIGINEYYSGGSFVPAGTSGNSGAIPSSGQISISQFYGSQSLIPKGYFAGGTLAPGLAYSTEIDGIRFDTEAAINPAATLSAVRSHAAGVNSSARGFVGGGSANPPPLFSYSTEIDGIRFDTEAAINPAATLALARHSPGGVNSSARGFFGGGTPAPGTGYSNEIDGIRFDTEAAINPAATLALARTAPSGMNSSARGFFGGGKSSIAGTSEWSNEIDGIRFDTEAAINPAATLPNAPVAHLGGRSETAAFNSETKGFFAGGRARRRTGGQTVVIDGFRFDTEACARIAATLSVARTVAGGVNSTARGFVGGGATPLSAYINTISGIRFDTEAAINPAATLSQARNKIAGFQCGAL
jgi:hypothetical protein